MFLLDYEGRWHDSAARNPELLVSLAPQHLQDACLTYGGTRNWFGEPLFRLVHMMSRFQISGGQMITFLDTNGNYQKCEEHQEVMLPRYHVAAKWHDTYVLEMWHPPQWYYEHGYGGAQAVDYSPEGKRFQNMEPVWDDGGFEAIWNGIQHPFCFPRFYPDGGGPLDIDMVKWAVYAVRARLSVEAEQIVKARKASWAAKEAKEKGTRLDMINDRIPAWPLTPHVSFAG